MARITTLKGSVAIPKKLSMAAFLRRRNIGAEIKLLREEAGLTINEAARAASVAADLDISFHTWMRWESGATAIPLEFVSVIATALGKTNILHSIKPYLLAA
jgi:transcriptional regulator with XRE-family HTH domain